MIARIKTGLLFYADRLRQRVEDFSIQHRLLQPVSKLILRFWYKDELQALHQGLMAHRQGFVPIADRYRLRRAVHRIEKGLSHTPRKEIFATNYILDTTTTFNKLVAIQPDLNKELEWEYDVLAEYFSSTSPHPEVEKARVIFKDAQKEIAFQKSGKVPFTFSPTRGISHEDLLAFTKGRRSLRQFSTKCPTQDELDKAFAVAREVPSACNRMPFRFVVLRDQKAIENTIGLTLGGIGWAEKVPVLIVALGDLSAFDHPRDRHLIYFDTALSMMMLTLGLQSQGIGSCMMQWPDLPGKDDDLRKIVFFEGFERPVVLMAAGYPKANTKTPFSAKKSLNEMRKYQNHE